MQSRVATGNEYFPNRDVVLWRFCRHLSQSAGQRWTELESVPHELHRVGLLSETYRLLMSGQVSPYRGCTDGSLLSASVGVDAISKRLNPIRLAHLRFHVEIDIGQTRYRDKSLAFFKRGKENEHRRYMFRSTNDASTTW